MNDDLRGFYRLVQGSRERVFAWAESLPPQVYTAEHPEFAYGSLRNIQAHIADCCLSWVGVRGLGMAENDVPSDSLRDVSAMRERFQQVDGVLGRAFDSFSALDEPLEIQWRQGTLSVTRRWLLLHPITHEFHHKGQMLALGRVLGHPYPPGPDTDLLLPSEV
ncbi:DinB family protein [Deinococcus ruber]|uniref:DNA damage-inducible protein DinB n=1 Tax=Deinococcus ruber TaxID=1848197 RepID=A0A918BV11_9DEIO|nr:DinB family protein [Deinococcus ruber]GGQ94233.1 DNA damage-inducible protein DinB [Deinococcus ruber]